MQERRLWRENTGRAPDMRAHSPHHIILCSAIIQRGRVLSSVPSYACRLDILDILDYVKSQHFTGLQGPETVFKEELLESFWSMG